MTYTVQYRTQTGSLATTTVEAASRAEAVSACRARGVTPLRVAEGGAPSSPPGRPRRVGAWVGAGIGAAILAGAGLWWATRPAAPMPVDDPRPAERRAAPKRSAPASAVKAPPKAVPEPTDAPAARPPAGKSLPPGETVVSSTVRTNSSGAVIERETLADGTTRSRIRPPAPVFRHVSDQVIALCLSAKPGQSMPPLPRLDRSLERDFVESLSDPVEIGESDPDDLRELKARVMETRAYLKDEIRSGRTTLLEALQAHQRTMEAAADAHAMAAQEIRRMRRNGGTQAEVDEFVRAVNESFRARGLPELGR